MKHQCIVKQRGVKGYNLWLEGNERVGEGGEVLERVGDCLSLLFVACCCFFFFLHGKCRGVLI